MQVTLDSFSGKRTKLQTTLKNRDKEALKTINAELHELAKQFFKGMRDAIRGHDGATGTADTARTEGIAGMTGAGSGLAAV